MNDFFSLSPNDPHAVFFAARIAGLVLVLGAIGVLTIVGTLVFLAWRDQVRKHKRYLERREQIREQHVRSLMAEQEKKDKLLYSDHSCIVTLPDADDIMRQIQMELLHDYQ